MIGDGMQAWRKNRRSGGKGELQIDVFFLMFFKSIQLRSVTRCQLTAKMTRAALFVYHASGSSEE